MTDPETVVAGREQRAKAIAEAGGIEQAIADGSLPKRIDTTVSEAIVLGLLRQDVRTFIGVFGHGSTELGEVLRVYEGAGLIRTLPVRHETAAAHAAASLRWVTGEKAAVFTSIGPGALQALAGSLTASSNQIGVWHIYGDETTEDEGPNMQQIPKHQQQLYLSLCQTMGESYCLHTPQSVGTALRRGLNTVDHPHQAGPFYLLLPMNTQASELKQYNLDELPRGAPPPLGAAADDGSYAGAIDAMIRAERVVVKLGGGARSAGPEILEFLDLVDGVAVVSPLLSGVIPYSNPRNMSLGGSKGSLSGNFAMDEADLLVAVGTRFVCQSDSSRTGYPKVEQVININTDVQAAMHYNRTIALVGDAAKTLGELNRQLKARPKKAPQGPSPWFQRCSEKLQEWKTLKAQRYDNPALYDEMWKEKVLTYPGSIKTATDWARAHEAVAFFDAGDVQGCGMQVVEDERLGQTFSDSGASYMGYAVSSLLASPMASQPFYGLAISGDGSFTMNPQILIDGVHHGVHGCIVVLDNRRMAAISGLQIAQYGVDYATDDNEVEVDYVAWAQSVKGVAAFDGGRTPQSLSEALDKAYAHPGLSLIHVPLYFGPDPMGGLGAYGRWNVGGWVEDVQALRHKIGL